MSAYLSPDVVVAIGRQRQNDIEAQANRWQLAKLAASGHRGTSGLPGVDWKSALLTRAGAVFLTWPRRAARQPEHLSPGRLTPRYQA